MTKNIFRRYILFTIVVLLTSGCVSSNMISDNGENDPFEQTNRQIFDFNNNLDKYFFTPVAKTWRKLPEFPKENLANLAETAYTPISLTNAILQLDKESISLILRRFIINVTFGIGGMYDLASSKEFGNVEKRNEDFGQTLARYGMAEGPYLMLPIFGPSNIRDAIGRGVDAVLDPVSFAFRINSIGVEGRLSQPVITGIEKREKYLDYIEEIKKSSLDYYATMRSLYRQKRKKDIFGLDNSLNKNLSYDIDPPRFGEEKSDVVSDVSYPPKKNGFKQYEYNKVNDVENVRGELEILNDDLPSSNYPSYNEEEVFLTN